MNLSIRILKGESKLAKFGKNKQKLGDCKFVVLDSGQCRGVYQIL